MRKADALRVLLCLLLACLAGFAHAQAPVAAIPDAPRIGVVTMGPGEIFWERFGHDAIVVDDPALGERISYNFGFFDMEEPGFIGRFVQGRMEYMLVALPLAQDMQYYREVGRGAGIQWLQLDPVQARQLAADLAENAKPENARYRYDYYTDNCATRVRDAINRVLGGRLQRELDGRSSGDTYRGESVRLASPALWMWLGFDIALGPYADRPLSRWEQAFLPRRLAEDLREATNFDGRPLVASEQELLPQRQAAEPEPQARKVMPWLLTGLALAITIVAFARRAPRSLAAFASLFWLLCGCIGLVLAFSWAFTDHRTLWANRNLLLFNPLCLLLLPGAFTLLRGRVPTQRFGMLLKVVMAVAALACAPLWLQGLSQRNGTWIALLLPIHAAFAWAWANARRTHA
ncbi:DUF4105 domain-containing protein [Thermomonas sp.]|uniref:lipoprotein N-acyltransferase Lnb domain-containing protein n=1 Tax=Thermomonas sp. TaxID=1971895 RepID=UPI002488838C|nr:DUF4105 domain-containing protein [Thermomonas sp.]MDI1252009.1 DUF4105 domain-containing protein [Thermomonas sp.]